MLACGTMITNFTHCYCCDLCEVGAYSYNTINGYCFTKANLCPTIRTMICRGKYRRGDVKPLGTSAISSQSDCSQLGKWYHSSRPPNAFIRMDDESSRSVRLVIFHGARYAVNVFRSWPETQNGRNNFSLCSQNRNNSHSFSLQLAEDRVTSPVSYDRLGP